jgi:hypothetical protein
MIILTSKASPAEHGRFQRARNPLTRDAANALRPLGRTHTAKIARIKVGALDN